MSARVLFTRSLAVLLLFSTLLFIGPFTNANLKAQQSSPPLLTYNELVELYENAEPSAPLANKLTRLLTTPFVNNSFGVRAATPIEGKNDFVRVATWNIERGLDHAAAEFMTREPKTIAADALVDDALILFDEYKITSLFVVEDDGSGKRPLGVLHIHDCPSAR